MEPRALLRHDSGRTSGDMPEKQQGTSRLSARTSDPLGQEEHLAAATTISILDCSPRLCQGKGHTAEFPPSSSTKAGLAFIDKMARLNGGAIASGASSGCFKHVRPEKQPVVDNFGHGQDKYVSG